MRFLQAQLIYSRRSIDDRRYIDNCQSDLLEV